MFGVDALWQEWAHTDGSTELAYEELDDVYDLVGVPTLQMLGYDVQGLKYFCVIVAEIFVGEVLVFFFLHELHKDIPERNGVALDFTVISFTTILEKPKQNSQER